MWCMNEITEECPYLRVVLIKRVHLGLNKVAFIEGYSHTRGRTL